MTTLTDFTQNYCKGAEYDTCVNSPCPYSSSSGCTHPLHPANQAEQFTGDEDEMNAEPVSQELIETVESAAMAALESYLQESGAPAWVGQVITDLRILDQLEGMDYSEWDNMGSKSGGAEAHRNADLIPLLSRLMEATYLHKAAVPVDNTELFAQMDAASQS